MKSRKNFVFWAFLLPMAVPAASVVLVWKLFFHQNGLINGALERLGLEGVNWMGSGFSFWVLSISYLWKNLGYTVVLWTAALGGIPASVYEAAQMDGANSLACFVYITLPNLKTSAYSIPYRMGCRQFTTWMPHCGSNTRICLSSWKQRGTTSIPPANIPVFPVQGAS